MIFPSICHETMAPNIDFSKSRGLFGPKNEARRLPFLCFEGAQVLKRVNIPILSVLWTFLGDGLSDKSDSQYIICKLGAYLEGFEL